MSKGDDTRATILDHATREAARVGLEGLTIGALAKDLGMSKSGLFAHFASKEALQVQILEAATDQFTDAVIRPALRAPRGLPRIVALFERWLDYLEVRRAEVGCLFLAAAIELDDRPGPARDQLVAQQRDWLEFIASVARAAVTEGHLRDDLDPTQLAHELFGVICAYHHATRLMRDPRALERTRLAFDRLLRDAQPR